MKRIQFYPSKALDKALEDEARKQKVPVSALVTGILERYFRICEGEPEFTDLTEEILEEIRRYINEPASEGKEFDLGTASPTYEQIPMTCREKPQTVRARVGKVFASLIGTPGDFFNIDNARNDNGKIKRNANNAAVYRIFAAEFNGPTKYAAELLRGSPDSPLAFAARTKSGELKGFAYRAEPGSPEGREEEDVFLAGLCESGECVLTHSVCIWRDGTPDVPSESLRRGLVCAAAENIETRHLLRGRGVNWRTYREME